VPKKLRKAPAALVDRCDRVKGRGDLIRENRRQPVAGELEVDRNWSAVGHFFFQKQKLLFFNGV
jgi:hypothetical protein